VITVNRPQNEFVWVRTFADEDTLKRYDSSPQRAEYSPLTSSHIAKMEVRNVHNALLGRPPPRPRDQRRDRQRRRAEVEDRTWQFTCAELIQKLNDAGVRAGPILGIDQVSDIVALKNDGAIGTRA
jgi:hypothetical protein